MGNNNQLVSSHHNLGGLKYHLVLAQPVLLGVSGSQTNRKLIGKCKRSCGAKVMDPLRVQGLHLDRRVF